MNDLIPRLKNLAGESAWGSALFLELAAMPRPQRVIDISRKQKDASKRCGVPIPGWAVRQFFTELERLEIGRHVVERHAFHVRGYNLKELAAQAISLKPIKLSTGKVLYLSGQEVGELGRLVSY